MHTHIPDTMKKVVDKSSDQPGQGYPVREQCKHMCYGQIFEMPDHTIRECCTKCGHVIRRGERIYYDIYARGMFFTDYWYRPKPPNMR